MVGVSPRVAAMLGGYFLGINAIGIGFLTGEGGLLYDALCSYPVAWRIGVAVGRAAGIIQVAFALLRPTEPPLVAAE
jgi:hypothetical protein